MINSVITGDCLEVLPAIADSSIDLIAVDPPYYKVKPDEWDRQWGTPDEFIVWLGAICDEFKRILKPNGSLYLFASPQMSWYVEGVLRERFAVLNNIRWAKPRGRHLGARKSDLRKFFPASETIFFCEQYGSDTVAKGVAGYKKKSNDLRAAVFEPLRLYLDSERQRAGVTPRQIQDWMRANGYPIHSVASHAFSKSQWALPTPKNYVALRACLNEIGSGDYLIREYEDLRREYEDLRREYEDLRRPFSAVPDAPYTDTWTFDTIQPYQGKHPCEKPIDMMRHIVSVSSRPGDVVLDCFAGSASTIKAAHELGRKYIGVEKDGEWAIKAMQRINYGDNTQKQWVM